MDLLGVGVATAVVATGCAVAALVWSRRQREDDPVTEIARPVAVESDSAPTDEANDTAADRDDDTRIGDPNNELANSDETTVIIPAASPVDALDLLRLRADLHRDAWLTATLFGIDAASVLTRHAERVHELTTTILLAPHGTSAPMRRAVDDARRSMLAAADLRRRHFHAPGTGESTWSDLITRIGEAVENARFDIARLTPVAGTEIAAVMRRDLRDAGRALDEAHDHHEETALYRAAALVACVTATAVTTHLDAWVDDLGTPAEQSAFLDAASALAHLRLDEEIGGVDLATVTTVAHLDALTSRTPAIPMLPPLSALDSVTTWQLTPASDVAKCALARRYRDVATAIRTAKYPARTAKE